VLTEQDRGSSYQLVSTSGNFRLGNPAVSSADVDNSAVTLNYEHYLFETLNPRNDLARIRSFLCFFRTVEGIWTETDIGDFSGDLGRCFDDWRIEHGVLSGEDFFLPTQANEFAAHLGYMFGASDESILVSYNFGNDILRGLIERALRNGNQVTILTDNDALCSALSLSDWLWLKGVDEEGATIRYIPTKGPGSRRALMHMKAMLFRGDNASGALAGSANFTCSAFCRNVEYMKILNENEIVQLSTQLDSMLQSSLEYDGGGTTCD
jgi:hypothetical protein